MLVFAFFIPFFPNNLASAVHLWVLEIEAFWCLVVAPLYLMLFWQYTTVLFFELSRMQEIFQIYMCCVLNNLFSCGPKTACALKLVAFLSSACSQRKIFFSIAWERNSPLWAVFQVGHLWHWIINLTLHWGHIRLCAELFQQVMLVKLTLQKYFFHSLPCRKQCIKKPNKHNRKWDYMGGNERLWKSAFSLN